MTMTSMNGRHGPDLLYSRTLSHVQNCLESGCSSDPENSLIQSLPFPARVVLSARKSASGQGLCIVRAFDAASISSKISSASTLDGDCLDYPSKQTPYYNASEYCEKQRGPASLPSKKGTRSYRWLRWGFGSVYRRIFTVAYIANLAVLALFMSQTALGFENSLTYDTATTAVTANLLAALLVRNEHVVNALFSVFGSWPRRAPLRARRLFAKVYSYGGIHSGCGVSATFWYVTFLCFVTREFATSDITLVRNYILLVSYTIILFLTFILFFSHPYMRRKLHNWFEGTHRYLGWSIILLFWAQTVLLALDTAKGSRIPLTMVLVLSPSFWMLIAATLLVIYPWTYLRLRDVEAEPLSDHVIKLNFEYAHVHYGQAVRLSDAPLKETHSFAVIPHSSPLSSAKPSSVSSSGTAPMLQYASNMAISDRSFSVLVSNAGDWTKKIIDCPPKKLWTRGLPQYGVMRVAGLFEPVIVVATGSGIGPCLSLFLEAPEHPVRIVWSAPSPVETYGQAVVDTILKADPRAAIIDTRKSGRPDLVAVTHRIWNFSRREEACNFALLQGADSGPEAVRKNRGQCEAVVVISNQNVTRKVVYGLESRGIPSYGAIFDS